MLDPRCHRMRRTATRTFATATVLLGLVAAATTGFAAPVESDSLSYFADGDSPPIGGGAAAPTKQAVVSVQGGALAGVASYPTSGQAADFPGFNGVSNAPRAVVAMTNTTTVDALTPLASPFSFGADIKLDLVSTGTPNDNGNNVVQRGLFGDPAQFKIQNDRGFALCRVKGDLGAVATTSRFKMPAEKWFRVSCTRKTVSGGDQLQLDVRPINADGTLGAVVRSTSAIQRVGRLSFAITTPVSIGGKLLSATQIASASDQFNGLIDNPVLNIG